MQLIPSGVILLWSGSAASIPPGWTLCDGFNGTPDLRDRFVVGADLTYAVGATGGAINHTHIYTGSGHDHTLPAGTDLAAGANFSATTATGFATGTTQNGDGRPPYYALCYIMRT